MKKSRYIFLFILLTCNGHNLIAEESTPEAADTQEPANQGMSNQELRDLSLPTISETDDDAESLRQAIERINIIEDKAVDLPLIILPHRPNYLMPFTYQQRPFNQPFIDVIGEDLWPGLDHVEAVFQISLKYQLAKLDKDNKHKLYIAYTNKSYWQVYNADASRPFRETNHEPELILQFNPDWRFINRLELAINHQSNGQYQGVSRSWNRIIGGIYHVSGSRAFGMRPWWRIPEDKTDDPNDPKDDDNPDIHKYIGYSDFVFYQKLGKQSIAVRFGNNFNFDKNRGWGEVEWNFPVTPRVRGFIQFYEGYGSNLIEYNHYQKRIGFGFKISDYL